MMMKNMAVVGAEYWGKNLVRNFSQLGVLKTVCETEPRTCEQIAKEYPDAAITGNFVSVLEDEDILGVAIAAPAVQHFQLAKDALLAGKHVFVDMPLALTYEEGEVLVCLAAVCGRILFVGHILNYHPAVIRLKEMVREGSIGRIQYVYSRQLNLGRICHEENLFRSFAHNDLSVILGLVDEEPVYVDSVGSNFLRAGIAYVTMTNLRFPSGISAHVFVSWLNPFKERRLVVVGSNGMFVFDDMLPSYEKLVFYPHTINWKNGSPTPVGAECQPIDLSQGWEEPLRAECRAFLSSMETGRPPVTSGAEGLKVLKIMELSRHSMEQKEKELSLYNNAERGTDFFSHPSAVIDDGASIGAGTKIWSFSHIMKGARIGERCHIGQNVVVEPKVTIGDGVQIQNNVSVHEGVTLEDEVFCGSSMVFANVHNSRSYVSRMKEVRPTLVKKGASLGANCTIVCGNTIGRYASVWGGAVVDNDVPDYALAAGNPAKIEGWMCVCGNRIDFDGNEGQCRKCGKPYSMREGILLESSTNRHRIMT